MAQLTRSLPLFSLLVFVVSCVKGTHLQSCHRVFPVQLTAVAMPCRYICVQHVGYHPQYRVGWEDDGTYCQKHGKQGVCWNGECLTRYEQEDQWSQQAQPTSKLPLRIRKRDVSSVTTKGATLTKTVDSSGDSTITTKGMSMTKSVKTSVTPEGTKSAAEPGLKGSYITSFDSQQSGTDTKNNMPSTPNLDIDPFAIKSTGSTGRTTADSYTGNAVPSHMSRGGGNGNVKIVIQRRPNGQTVTTRTVRRLIITKGPTKTVRRIIIKHHRPMVGAGHLMNGGNNGFATKTVKHSVSRGSLGETNGFMLGGRTDVGRKASHVITLQTTKSSRRNPIASIVRTIQQQRISGGQNAPGTTTATKTISTVAVTKGVSPSLSVVKVTKQSVAPLTAASMETSNTAPLRGLEVEVPGYTAGLRHQWKWVLARRVGVYPPYVQVLDPEVLYYKLRLQNPNLPSLPGPVQDILNRVPVHPVGSDIYGYLLSSKILEKIRGFTEGVNSLTKLRSMLSTSNKSNQDNSNPLTSLLTGAESSPSGSALLQKLIFSSLSGSGNNPLNLPYAGYPSSVNGALFGRPYNIPWAPLVGSQFPGSPWPFYNGPQSPLGRIGQNPPLDSSDISMSSTGAEYMLPEDENSVPSAETPAPENPESLLGGTTNIKSLLESIIRGSRHGHSLDESPVPASEKLARALGEAKLRYLLKPTNRRSSLVHRINKALRRGDYHKVLVLLRNLGVRPNSRVYNRIVQDIVLNRKHRNLGYNGAQDVISMLLERSRKNVPRSPEPLESRPNGPRELSEEVIELLQNLRRPELNKGYGPLAEILLTGKHRRHPSRPRDTYDSPQREEVIEALLDLSRREPSTERTSDLRKQITKALLSSGHGPISTHGTQPSHLSKLVPVQRATHTEARPHGLTQADTFPTAYQMNTGAAPAPMQVFPAPAPALEVTRQLTQQSQPTGMLGINGFSTATSGQPFPQPYPQFVPQAYFPNAASGVSEQSTLVNRPLVAPTGGVYSSPQGQSATTMMSGTGGYSSYATVPTSTAYMSQYATQPYYLGTTLYGGHPHYVVEGHEAPGTRWQLRVWRHHPGVSYVAPGFSGFQSSHLGSVVARARETVTNGLQLGSQPGHFGFTTFGSGLPGGAISAASSQYVLKAPDGSIVLNRQPLYGSVTQSAPTSSVVVSQTKTTKTVSGTAIPTVSTGLSGSSFQSSVEGAGSTGTTKSDSLSEITQTKQSTSLLNSLDSNSDSQNKESLFGSDGASSSSTQSDSGLSQSKLRR